MTSTAGVAVAADVPVSAGSRRTVGGALRRHWLLSCLVVAGVVLRAAGMAAGRPVLMLWGDSYSYLFNARHLRPEAFHPIGYALLLRALWWTGDLHSVVAVQHLLGLFLGGAVYATLVRLRVRPWLAALGVAPILLDAYQVNIEQTVLAETLFETLVTGALILLVWNRRPGVGACLLSGVLLGAATLTRGIAAAAAIPALLIFLLVRRLGVLRSLALLVALVLPVVGYGFWYRQFNGSFGIEGYSGRLLYGRMEPLAYNNCGHLRLPPDERVLCDPLLGADPVGAVAADTGVNFYTWAPDSPYMRLRPGSRERLALSYSEAVAIQEPLRYLWSIAVDTAHYFAPDRTQVAQGQWPVQAWQFRPETDPSQYHVLLGTNKFGQPFPRHLPPPQREHWPARLLADYQTFGFTSGLVMLAAVLLNAAALLPRRLTEEAAEQRSAALLFGLCGLLLIVVAAAVAGLEPRYMLPSLPLIPPAGALALSSLSGRLRSSGSGCDRP